MDFLNKLMPQSKEAEQYLLGCVLRDKNIRDDFFGKLKKEDFYFHPHQIAYECIQKIYRRNIDTDMVALFTEIQKASLLDDFGGAVYLSEIWDAAPTSANFDHFTQEVISKAKLRMMIREMTQLISQAYEPNVDSDALLSMTEAKIVEISNHNRSGVEFESLKNSAIGKAIQHIKDVRDGKITPALETGFSDLDVSIGGFHPKQLIILAARPSVGKTAFAMNVAMNVAKTQGNVLFISGEQSSIEIATRVLANEGMAPLNVLNKPNQLYDSKARQVENVQNIVNDYKYDIILDERTMLTPDEVLTAVRRAKRKHDIKLVVIDYLQRLSHTGGKNASLSEKVGNTAKMLKTTAKVCDVPVLCLAQLNRESVKMGKIIKNAKPSLENLRDSGEIEQEADLVILMHPDANEEVTNKGLQKIDLIIAKQRSGPQGEITLNYMRPYIKYENWVPLQANTQEQSSTVPNPKGQWGRYGQEDS